MVPDASSVRMTNRAKALGIALLLLNVADLVITFIVLGRGGVELNPLSAWLIEQKLIIPIKIGICLWIAFSVFFLERSVNKLQFKVLAVVTGIYAFVVTWNCVMLLWRH
jgi:hypothetical protein